MNDKAYNKYINACGLYDFRDKANNIRNHIAYMLMRSGAMFEWHNLPDTIPQEYLEQYLQTVGYVGIIKAGEDLYAVTGGLGGEPDAYYQPTILTVANPYLESKLKADGLYKIGEDCEIIKNDTYYMGLLPMYQKYASQLAENELSLNIASINTRLQKTLKAGDDVQKKACDKYMQDIIEGKLESLLDDSFEDKELNSVQMDTSRTGIIGDLIEYQQYIKASWYNEIGLNANYNMKREALNSAESSINDDILFPLIDQMLSERRQACDRINAMFDTDISVDLASSWRDNKEEEENTIESINPDQEPTPVIDEEQRENGFDITGDTEDEDTTTEDEDTTTEDEDKTPEDEPTIDLEDKLDEIEDKVDEVLDEVTDEDQQEDEEEANE